MEITIDVGLLGIIGIVATLLMGGPMFVIFFYNQYQKMSFWTSERKMHLFRSSTIFAISSMIFLFATYASVGFALILLHGDISFTDALSPLTNKVLFTVVFGLAFTVTFGYTLYSSQFSFREIAQTIRGDDQKHFGGIM